MLLLKRISVESKIRSFPLFLTFLFEENIMSKTIKTIIHTDKAPAAIGAYSQAVRAGDTVYMSGQIPLDPATMTVVGDGDFRAEAVQVFKNLQAVAEAAGGSLNDIVKLNAYLTDLANFAVFNEVMAEFIEQPFPARAAVGVASLPKGIQVEAEAVLVLNA